MTAALILPVEQTRAEGCIGASDAAAVLGLDKYRSPLSVWRGLRGEPRSERPQFVQDAAKFGQLLEPIIRGLYAQQTKSAVYVPKASAVLDDWLRCTPDGYVFCDSAIPGTSECERQPEGADGLLQVKTASAYKADEWADGRVPPAYEVQVRVEMAVTGLPWCDLVCLIGGQRMTAPVRIVRDEKLEHNILTALWVFWQKVQTGEEPDVDGSDSWREYASARMRKSDVELIADEDTNRLIGQLREFRRAEQAAKGGRDLINNELLLRMSAAGATKIASEHGRVTAYKTGASTRWKEYALSLGGAAKPPAEFVRESTTWAVRAPKEFGEDDE